MAKPIRFVIVGDDMPLLSVGLTKDLDNSNEMSAHVSEFLLYSSLDIVNENKDSTSSNYLGVIDKVNSSLISAYITAGNRIFLLLHKEKKESLIQQFFEEINEYYVRFIMNPFYKYNMPIRSIEFETKVKEVAENYLY